MESEVGQEPDLTGLPGRPRDPKQPGRPTLWAFSPETFTKTLSPKASLLNHAQLQFGVSQL